ncbi:UPF0182 family protein [Synechococcus sp. CCY9201]|uniref:UPF0182 family protein n=1 Tax=unclassified Synechococcus TaxID=2626047 RepID=UPI001E4D0F29|nr:MULTISPECIES: UPF0182 family protein [unclassified Synechococcus]MEA5423230.1 UPF0182 family protein [Synechococcus sp. CCY9202]MEA5473720.1 UPF0182 family protein [Synechococcus sp. CCY9201]CAK6693712.1 hypothetical protein IFHNHDMJ_01478 [Synechococcus sp. CBW1107]
MTTPRLSGLSLPQRLLLSLVVGMMGVLLLWSSARLWIEWQWFAQFGFSGVLLLRWTLQLAGLGVGLALALGLQLWLRHLWRLPRLAPERHTLPPLAYGGVLTLLAGLQVVALTIALWLARRLLLAPFDPSRLHGLIALEGPPSLPMLLASALVLLALLIRPMATARLVAGVLGAAGAMALARGWSLWSVALVARDAGITEPLLGADISFALLRFPALAFLLTLLSCLLIGGLACGLWGVLARPPQLSDGRFAGFTPPQLLALRAPLAALSLLAAAAFWLGRHQLLLSTVGSVPGAGWFDVHVSLPLRTLAALLALTLAVVILVPLPRRGLRGAAIGCTALALAATPLVEALLLPLVQLLVVKPRELERETPYLERSIRATRHAFQLDRISSRNVNPRDRLTRADVEQGQATLRNIRLWDSQPLLATNRQLQQLRVYYRFSEPAVDRYALRHSQGSGRQQVIITPREMDQAALPTAARTWLNRHLVFTHGNGFTVSPVNTSGPDGLPEFFISDLGASTRVQGSRQLGISAAAVKAGIPIGRPALYFGALSSPYALAPSKVEEFDYPQGDDNFYSRYSGTAGVPIGHPWQRLAASLYLSEPKLLSQGALTSSTRLLLRREVRERLRTLAPFLRFENEPYLVSVQLRQDGHFPRAQHQYWIVDAFTTSRTYPYSAAVPGDPDIRYLRNSVKAVVDAYNGSVQLYVSEPTDPIIASWRRLFPGLFQPLWKMPDVLQAHIRYPLRQFELQTTQLLRYHVTDPRVFYSGDDVWQVPMELYGNSQVPVKPYHISGQVAGRQQPEFLLLQPLTPLARPNLAGWLAARSDAPHYGELVLLRFPSQTPIFGPEQIQALINQNPRISQQFGLWDRAGSQVIQGNLLVMPVGEALLYVEPVYLKARNGGLPTLTRVVVSDGTRIAMEETLEKGIEALLDPRRSNLATQASPSPQAPIADP